MDGVRFQNQQKHVYLQVFCNEGMKINDHAELFSLKPLGDNWVAEGDVDLSDSDIYIGRMKFRLPKH